MKVFSSLIVMLVLALFAMPSLAAVSVDKPQHDLTSTIETVDTMADLEAVIAEAERLQVAPGAADADLLTEHIKTVATAPGADTKLMPSGGAAAAEARFNPS